MVLHSDTIKAILSYWNAPKYDGSQDVRQWLREIEKLCEVYGIPPAQMTEMAIKCTAGEANTVLTAMLGTKVSEAGVWPWTDFKECVIQIEDGYRENTRDAPQNVEDGDFRSEHPYVAAALGVTMIGVGTAVVLPAITVGILGAVGFGAGGVGAGSIAAGLQSVLYGGATGGLFSVFQSLGATMVAPPLFTTLAGFGTAAAGRWFTSGTSTRDDPTAEESQDESDLE